MNNFSENDWIRITSKRKDMPKEVRIDRAGNVYIDGELYDPATSKYRNLSVSVEKHEKVATGEETEKMLESQKKAAKGETVIITDYQDPTKTESTTVKF